MKLSVVFASTTLAMASQSIAAVSEDEAKQLGGPMLTEWGSEKAPNKDGSIPAYTAERVKAPANYNPKEPTHVPDPFGDKPLYSITAQNVDTYADKLSVGQREMFRKYPNYRMDIYQSHRTVIFPKYVIDNTLKNAIACKAVNGGIKLEGCYGGVPFPIPKTGNEVIWNHLVRYNPAGAGGFSESWIIDSKGNRILQGNVEQYYRFPFWDPDKPGVRAPNSDYRKLRFQYNGPARKVGEKYVILNPLDPINPGQRAWTYIAGQRRVKLAPDLAYDTPNPSSGGAATMDELQGFLGAQDRFDFKLLGKKERYLVVNSNKTYDHKLCPAEVSLTKNFINPDCVRFELRRTWEIGLTLKPGFRNILPKRTTYVDEDYSGAAVGDNYDAGGKIYRIDYSPIYLFYQYDQPIQASNDAWTYDLQTGMVALVAFAAIPGGGVLPMKPLPDNYFSPEAIAAEGIR